jgi:3-hydroxymyristoyl/3-hydroxydecanoyl-(acyl carrier protein) dehydratase
LELAIPDDLSCLEGHFRGFPIVPGVLQLDWVIRYALEWRGREPKSLNIDRLKFKRPLLPGDRPKLTLETDDGGECFRFRLADDAGDFSTGNLVCVGEHDA